MAKILLVEDEESLRENLEIVFRHQGFDVITACNGHEGLERILEKTPDIVVSDISMPVMSGLAMLENLRQNHPHLAEIPVILLTALSERENVIHGRGIGADDYLTKPIDYDLLKATVEARLSRSQQATALKEQQFVRLFRNLQKTPKVEEDKEQEPLERLGDIAEPSLKGRVQIINPHDFYRTYPDEPSTIRDKIKSTIERIVFSIIGPSDVVLPLGGGTLLVALAIQDREEASRIFSQIRSRIGYALGQDAQLSQVNMTVRAHNADSDVDGNSSSPEDNELSKTLKDIFATARDSGDDNDRSKESFGNILKNIKIKYEPVWNSSTKSVDVHNMVVSRSFNKVEIPDGITLFGKSVDPFLCDFQSFLIDAAVQDVMAMKTAPSLPRRPATIIIPLSIHSFLKIDSYKVERRLEDAGKLISNSEIGFFLEGIDSTVSLGDLRRIFGLIAPISKVIAANFDADYPYFQQIRKYGCSFLNINYRTLQDTRMPSDLMLRIAAESIRRAAQWELPVWISHVDTSPCARFFVSNAARYLSGRLIGDPKPTFQASYRLTAEKVLLTM